MAKQMIGTRIPESWIVRLKELSESTGMSQSDLIYQAVAKLIGEDVISVSDRITVIEAEVETIKQRLVAFETETVKIAPPSVSRKIPVRLDVQGDKARCPTCGLNLLRREGLGKICRKGENIGRRKQRWTCLNPKCDRCGRSFLGNWAD